MTENARNTAIGLTVLVALALLGGMILIFAGLPGPLRGGYEVKIRLAATGGALEGDLVHLTGLPVGKITEVRFADDDPRQGVLMIVRIDSDVPIPGNVKAFVSTKGIAGGAFVDLRPVGDEQIDPRTGKPRNLKPGDVVGGVVKGGFQLSPELDSTLVSVRGLAEQLTKLVGTQNDLTPSPDTKASLFTAVASLNRILAGIERVFGTVSTEKSVEEIVANTAEATARGVKALEAIEQFAKEAQAAAKEARGTFSAATTMVAASQRRIDQLAGKLVDGAEKLSALLATLNRAAMKIESGTGSAGRLLNDPKLYNNLLEAARQLGLLMEELREMVKLWKAGGVGIKLK